jgi:hypothetical protein
MRRITVSPGLREIAMINCCHEIGQSGRKLKPFFARNRLPGSWEKR